MRRKEGLENLTGHIESTRGEAAIDLPPLCERADKVTKEQEVLESHDRPSLCRAMHATHRRSIQTIRNFCVPITQYLIVFNVISFLQPVAIFIYLQLKRNIKNLIFILKITRL